MPKEIERKFLLSRLPENLGQYRMRQLTQGYLNFAPAVRVREDILYSEADPAGVRQKLEEKYELTYKGGESRLSHTEYNLPLDRASYENLLAKHEGSLITKERYLIPLGRYTAELDLFSGVFSGVRIVEVEFPTEEEAERFEAPEWFGEDVTESGLYSNARMALAKVEN